MRKFQLPKSRKVYIYDRATGKMVEKPKASAGETTIERLWVPEGATTDCAPSVLTELGFDEAPPE
jgi:hypothetical protein